MPRNKNTLVKQNGGLIAEGDLATLGYENIEGELTAMIQGFYVQPPRVRIEHSATGRHRMFIDNGESYSEEAIDQVDLPNNELAGIVCYAQSIRAMWVEQAPLPTCAAIDERPTVAEPVHPGCVGCPQNHLGSKCKPKVRLLVLTWVNAEPTLVVFNLSPTSIKRWRNHVNKLARSKAPFTAVITRFNLQDTTKNSYRWAEVAMDVDRVVSKEELRAALAIRDQYIQRFVEVDESDFSDPGDKAEG